MNWEIDRWLICWFCIFCGLARVAVRLFGCWIDWLIGFDWFNDLIGKLIWSVSCFDWLVDSICWLLSLVDWFDWVIDLVPSLINRLVNGSIGWLVCWLLVSWVDPLTAVWVIRWCWDSDWFINTLFHCRLLHCMVELLVICCLIDCYSDLGGGWFIDWSSDVLICLVGWFVLLVDKFNGHDDKSVN